MLTYVSSPSVASGVGVPLRLQPDVAVGEPWQSYPQLDGIGQPFCEVSNTVQIHSAKYTGACVHVKILYVTLYRVHSHKYCKSSCNRKAK